MSAGKVKDVLEFATAWAKENFPESREKRNEVLGILASFLHDFKAADQKPMEPKQ